jgi:uncharacterized protein (DUF697 family)/GTP-binding protein EngB required for normal cell division
MIDLKSKLDEEFKKIKATIKKPNILLVGATGVGKSSLINYCFGKQLANSGNGRPITKSIDRYTQEGIPIVIYDAGGYEIGGGKESDFDREVIGLCGKKHDFSEEIHICWYCISNPGSRVTDFDISNIRKIKNSSTPVIVVLTKSDQVSDESSAAMKGVLKDAFHDIDIYEVSTVERFKGMDYASLIEKSINLLPSSLQMAFVAAQRVSINAKRVEAKKLIKEHSVLAFGASFSPIPFTSAALLIGNQTALIARIITLYNIDGLDSHFTLILEGAISTLLPMIGEWTVAQVLKFIPGIGTFIGGALNASVASSITFALGSAISEACAYFYDQAIDGEDGNSGTFTGADFEKKFLEFAKNQQNE